jgi:hypothetical protein
MYIYKNTGKPPIFNFIPKNVEWIKQLESNHTIITLN